MNKRPDPGRRIACRGRGVQAGSGNATDYYDIALGSYSHAAGAGATAVGGGAQATADGAIAIGDVTYTFAGTNPQSVVSVGAPGSERQVTNVAADQLSANGTDAVNGSQLYPTNQAINALDTLADAGWSLSANGGANGPVSLAGLGLDNGGNRITNIAAGTDLTDVRRNASGVAAAIVRPVLADAGAGTPA